MKASLNTYMDFYPANAAVPEEKRTDRLLMRPLRATDVELDYDAVMSSAEQLRRWSRELVGPPMTSRWHKISTTCNATNVSAASGKHLHLPC